MKALIVGLIALFLNSAWSAPNNALKEYMQNGWYYSALHRFLLDHGKAPHVTKEHLKVLESLLTRTGVEILQDYKQDLIGRFSTPSVNFHFGRLYVERADYQTAIKYLSLVPDDHRYASESLYLRSFAEVKLGKKLIEVGHHLNSCISLAKNKEKKVSSGPLQRYYQFIRESCMIFAARESFNQQEWQKSLDYYKVISKKSFKWPYLLLEMAWASYHLGDYNRTLGLLVTYQNPLLEGYFIPEAEVLNALSYYRLCLWQDSMNVVDHYYEEFKNKTEVLHRILMTHKDSQTYFYELLKMKAQEREKIHPFVHKLALQVSKEMRYMLDMATITKIDNEITKMRKAGAKQSRMIVHLEALKDNWKGRINYYAKEQFIRFINQVYAFSEEMFKVKLEILAQKKDLIYKKRELVSSRSRGSFDEVKRTKFEYFWKFNGSFWADELGDYSFGLQSNCQTKRKAEQI
jgi:hypothetical protein